MTSYLFNGQWTSDKNERKYGHMSIIPFAVCAYAAVAVAVAVIVALAVTAALAVAVKKWNKIPPKISLPNTTIT